MPTDLVTDAGNKERSSLKHTIFIIFIIVFGIYLGIISVCDIRTKKVSVFLLGLGFFIVGVFGILKFHLETTIYAVPDTLLGMAPGAGLLLLAKITHKAGTADGLVCMMTGVLFGLRESFFILSIGLFISSVWCIFGLMVLRWNKDKEIPFLPFVFISYMVCGIAYVR